MKRSSLAFAGIGLVLPAHVAAAPLGPDAEACQPGSATAAILVNVTGFRRQAGTIRVQLNGGNPSTWLQKNAWLKRIELPVTAPAMPVCVRLPGPGRYAIAVRHDEDGDRKMTSKDGGGYSRNPRLSITHLRPDYDEVAFEAGRGVTSIRVVMNYLSGLSIRPVN